MTCRYLVVNWCFAAIVTLAHAAVAQDCSGPLYLGQVFDVGGEWAEDMVAGDFNGDGVPDLALCDTTRSVRVVLGLGDGFYGEARISDTTWGAFLLATGDLDGDGDLDLVAALPVGGQIALLFNNGAGAMAPAVLLAVGSFPSGVAVEDLDGDGDADISVCNARSGDASILLNEGSGIFAPQVRVPVSREPSAMAAGDVDGDGDMDLVFVDWHDEFIVLTNDGSAGFTVADRRPAGAPRLTRLSLFDADGDGHLDAAVGGFPLFGLTLFRGAGDGTFPDQDPLPLDAHAESIRPFDFDGDGDLDLASGTQTGPVRVLMNDGGIFTRLADSDLTPFDATQVAWADADGDGDTDLVAAAQGQLVVLEADGLGRFVLYSTYDPGDIGATRPNALATADMDGDSDQDLVATLHDGNSVGVALNDAGVLSPMQTFAAGVGMGDLALGDIDGDGDTDVAIAFRTSNRVVVLFNDGAGRLGSARSLAGVPGCRAIALGDIDSDGDLDVAAVSSDDFNLLVVFENASGSFDIRAYHVLNSNPRSVAMADLDGDGDIDAVVGHQRDEAIVLLNNGSGTFAASASPPEFNGTIRTVDLDGDGLIDLVAGRASGVDIALGLGGGEFAPRVTIDAGTSVGDTAFGDANGDGWLDIFTTTGVLTNTGAAPGVLAFDGAIYLPDGAFEVAVADIDDSGRPDILVSGHEIDGVAILPHRCKTPCRADLDRDGILTIFDFLAFQNAFDAGDLTADFDSDGVLTIFDFLAFQNEFDLGCE